MKAAIISSIRRMLLGSSENSSSEMSYVWCLSTGRVGSQTLEALSSRSPNVVARHEPEPKLFGLSNLAYCTEGDSDCRRILIEAARLCRPPVKVAGETIYLETSPQATFLAQELLDLYPQSKFIHMIRHPADVIRSGMRRGWYSGHPNDAWRIQPTQGADAELWAEMSPLEKNAWLWAETNRWIYRFMETLPEGAGLLLRSEDLFAADMQTLTRLFHHLGTVMPKECEIQKVLSKKLNSQKKGHFPDLSNWEDSEVEVLKRHTGQIAAQYGYTL